MHKKGRPSGPAFFVYTGQTQKIPGYFLDK